MRPDRFHLGTHHPGWLATTDVPLFVSHRRLAGYRTLPRAATRWALDSGGFSELSMYGEWRTTTRAYATAVRRYRDDIGRLDWAAPQDWMCEPAMLARTGLTVAEHQTRTVRNWLDLKTLDPDLPIAPVLQGWTLDDYQHCADLYDRAGIDLTAQPVVGLGSVCRRQATPEIGRIVRTIAARGLRLHGFGVKITGLRTYGHHLASADSMAWSYAARRRPPTCDRISRTTGVALKNCANCAHYALDWRTRVLAGLTTQADRAEVGSDEYVDLHTIAARIRAAAPPTTHGRSPADHPTETPR